MTEVDNMPSTGVRWESGQIEDDFEGGNNSAKLFERSRIKALAGKWLEACIFEVKHTFN